MNIETFDSALCKRYLPLPKVDDHKYRRGILGCVTGSKEYPGAALLTTSAAIAVGIGMVRYFGPVSPTEMIANIPGVISKLSA